MNDSNVIDVNNEISAKIAACLRISWVTNIRVAPDTAIFCAGTKNGQPCGGVIIFNRKEIEDRSKAGTNHSTPCSYCGWHPSEPPKPWYNFFTGAQLMRIDAFVLDRVKLELGVAQSRFGQTDESDLSFLELVVEDIDPLPKLVKNNRDVEDKVTQLAATAVAWLEAINRRKNPT